MSQHGNDEPGTTQKHIKLYSIFLYYRKQNLWSLTVIFIFINAMQKKAKNLSDPLFHF